MKTGVKIVVTGGRLYGGEIDLLGNYTEKALDEQTRLYKTLDFWLEHHGLSGLAHGGAPGADFLAGCWAGGVGIPVQVFKAEWSAYGNQAGPLRNKRMLDEYKPEFVLAFPGGKGTEHCTQAAKLRKIPVVVVRA